MISASTRISCTLNLPPSQLDTVAACTDEWNGGNMYWCVSQRPHVLMSVKTPTICNDVCHKDHMYWWVWKRRQCVLMCPTTAVCTDERQNGGNIYWCVSQRRHVLMSVKTVAICTDVCHNGRMYWWVSKHTQWVLMCVTTAACTGECQGAHVLISCVSHVEKTTKLNTPLSVDTLNANFDTRRREIPKHRVSQNNQNEQKQKNIKRQNALWLCAC